jgi:hypothetical protein
VREQLGTHLLASLQMQMQNLLVLTGLGTSLEVGGPTMGDLWELCVGSSPPPSVDAVLTALNYRGPDGNIEELLSRCDAQLHASGDVADLLDDEERQRLHRAIRRGIEDVELGRTVDARTAIDRLRARALLLDARKAQSR